MVRASVPWEADMNSPGDRPSPSVSSSVRLPALPDRVLEQLPTPCLVIDVEACQRNIDRAAAYFATTKAKLRPHFKAHKCIELLRRQMAAGSCVGVTCATAAEAEVVAGQGFDDILVANQVVDRPALAALGRAASMARAVTVAVDHEAHVSLLAAEACRAGVTFGVLIEIDVGMGRCGLPPGSDQLEPLAAAIDSAEGLELRGLQGYEGHAVQLPNREDRRGHIQHSAKILSQERDRLRQLGHDCDTISGGGTGTFDLAAEAGVLDEVQAGSYVLMDAHYAGVGLPFENALFMVTTVISHQRATAVTINAGLKALTVEYGMPRPVDPRLEVLRLADEHAWVAVYEDMPLHVADSILLIPAHIDPAINLHDVLFAWDARSATLEPWAVDARRVELDEWLG